jgi:putative flippase GtrA
MQPLIDRMYTVVETLFSYKFLRFLIVGALNTAIGYGIYSLLVLLGLFPELALLIATILGTVVNYATTGRLVFGNRGNGRLFRFVLVYGVVYLPNAATLRLLLHAGLGPLTAQAIVLPAAATATFFAFRKLVFRQRSP